METKLDKIKELLFGKPEEKEKTKKVEVKAEDIKLAQEILDNGTVLEAEAFEAGNDVFIVSDDERIPLPVGDYELEDGRVLIVEEEGVIASIGEAEEVEQKSEFVTVEVFEKAINDIKSMLTSHDEEVLKTHEVEKSELSAEIKTLETKLSEKPAAKKISSSPKTENINMTTISPNRRKTTQDTVWDIIFKNK